jgi:hypothetical protein
VVGVLLFCTVHEHEHKKLIFLRSVRTEYCKQCRGEVGPIEQCCVGRMKEPPHLIVAVVQVT